MKSLSKSIAIRVEFWKNLIVDPQLVSAVFREGRFRKKIKIATTILEYR